MVKVWLLIVVFFYFGMGGVVGWLRIWVIIVVFPWVSASRFLFANVVVFAILLFLNIIYSSLSSLFFICEAALGAG